MFLVEQGIHSISLNPDTVLRTTLAMVEAEHKIREEAGPPLLMELAAHT
jgi:hypothetical protein